jgi:hypothetical protein
VNALLQAFSEFLSRHFQKENLVCEQKEKGFSTDWAVEQDLLAGVVGIAGIAGRPVGAGLASY